MPEPEQEVITGTDTLAVGYDGPGPHHKSWQVIRCQPSGRVFRIDYMITDGHADPTITELPGDWDPKDWRAQ